MTTDRRKLQDLSLGLCVLLSVAAPMLIFVYGIPREAAQAPGLSAQIAKLASCAIWALTAVLLAVRVFGRR